MKILMQILMGISTAVLIGCQSTEADTGSSDTENASDSQSTDSGEDRSSDGTDTDFSGDSEMNTSSETEMLDWDDFDVICYAVNCVDDTCRGFGADECPNCPEKSKIADVNKLEDTTGFTDAYICYYPPACGGSICTQMISEEDVTGWTCAVRPC